MSDLIFQRKRIFNIIYFIIYFIKTKMNRDFWNMLESDSLSIPCSIESEILESGIFPEKSNDSLIFNFEND